MDPQKVQAILNWPAPTSIKDLQCFLGFANFYSRFIPDFRCCALPLTSLLKGKPKTLKWSPEAQTAFQQLKRCFTSAPVLIYPNLAKKFAVEVDASCSGARAVL